MMDLPPALTVRFCSLQPAVCGFVGVESLRTVAVLQVGALLEFVIADTVHVVIAVRLSIFHNQVCYLITTQTIPFYSIMLKNIRFLNRIYVINESFIYRAEGRYL